MTTLKTVNSNGMSSQKKKDRNVCPIATLQIALERPTVEIELSANAGMRTELSLLTPLKK